MANLSTNAMINKGSFNPPTNSITIGSGPNAFTTQYTPAPPKPAPMPVLTQDQIDQKKIELGLMAPPPVPTFIPNSVVPGATPEAFQQNGEWVPFTPNSSTPLVMTVNGKQVKVPNGVMMNNRPYAYINGQWVDMASNPYNIDPNTGIVTAKNEYSPPPAYDGLGNPIAPPPTGPLDKTGIRPNYDYGNQPQNSAPALPSFLRPSFSKNITPGGNVQGSGAIAPNNYGTFKPYTPPTKNYGSVKPTPTSIVRQRNSMNQRNYSVPSGGGYAMSSYRPQRQATQRIPLSTPVRSSISNSYRTYGL